MDNEINNFLLEYNDKILCAFVIGSYVYSNSFNDIDIVVISEEGFFQKCKIIKNKEVKVTFLPQKMLDEDLENDSYGSFVYGRFLNPVKAIKNSDCIFEYQKKSITKELKYHSKIIKNERDSENILRNFIINRGLYFNKYLKNLNVIKVNNKNIKCFCDMVLNAYSNEIIKEKYTRSSENIFNYWKTRFSVKGIPLNLNDMIKLYNFKLNENSIIEEDYE